MRRANRHRRPSRYLFPFSVHTGRSDFEKLHPGLRLRGEVESRDSKDRVDEDLINEQLKACLRELDRIRDGESAFNREIEAANDELDHIAEMKDELETM